jgi:hypothetical protein
VRVVRAVAALMRPNVRVQRRAAVWRVRCNALLGVHPGLQELTKLLHRQTGVASDAAHRECVDRVVARNGQYSLTIAHDDVFTLTDDPKPGFL